MRLWLSLSVLVLASACDDCKTRVEEHDGKPMTIHPDDGPFTRAQLIKIARHYYPAMQYAESQARTSEEVTRIAESTPQWQARYAVYQQAMAHRGPWRDLVRTLEIALPDYYVTDRTIPYLVEPVYVVEIAPKDESREGELLGMVSAIAPLYFICQPVADRTLRHPIDDDWQAAVNALTREILARYPYHLLDHAIGMTIVPGLQAGNIEYGETTLIDLLLSTKW